MTDWLTRGPKGHTACTRVQCANFLTDQPGKQFLFTDWPGKKHKLGRGHWDLASCQLSLNSVQRFQSKSWKCLSQWQTGADILFFRSTRKNTKFVEDVDILLPVKFCWIPFSGFRGEVENVSYIRDRSGHLVFLIGPKNTILVEDFAIMLPVKFRWIQFSGFWGEVENVSANDRPSDHLIFPIGPKNTNLVEDVKNSSRPFKFRNIRLNGFRGEVENVSANQNPGRPSFTVDRPEKHKLGRLVGWLFWGLTSI